MKFLQFDSPFMVRYRRVVDYILLGLLWIITSAPLITFGAATTAMFQTVEYTVRENELKFMKPFFQRFRKEFKQSTVLWLIEVVILAVLVFYAVLVYKSELYFLLKVLSYLVIAFIFMWVQLWFGYASKFEDSVKTVMINCLRITLANLGTSVLMALLTAVMLLVVCIGLVYFAPVVLLVPGIYIMLDTILLRKMFKKLLPEEAAPEELPEELTEELVEE